MERLQATFWRSVGGGVFCVQLRGNLSCGISLRRQGGYPFSRSYALEDSATRDVLRGSQAPSGVREKSGSRTTIPPLEEPGGRGNIPFGVRHHC